MLRLTLGALKLLRDMPCVKHGGKAAAAQTGRIRRLQLSLISRYIDVSMFGLVCGV